MFVLLLLLLPLLCALISFANSCSIVEIDVTFGAFAIKAARRLDFGDVVTTWGVVFAFVVRGNVFVFIFIARRLLSSLLEAIISRIIVELIASLRADDDDSSAVVVVVNGVNTDVIVVVAVVGAECEFVSDNAVSGFEIIVSGIPVVGVGVVVAFESLFESVKVVVVEVGVVLPVVVVIVAVIVVGTVVAVVVHPSAVVLFVFSACCPLDFDLRETQLNDMRRLPELLKNPLGLRL